MAIAVGFGHHRNYRWYFESGHQGLYTYHIKCFNEKYNANLSNPWDKFYENLKKNKENEVHSMMGHITIPKREG